jgi:hypothetical protein
VAEPGVPSQPAPLWRRALVGFGRFWWDFLVGDTPELLIGVGIVVGIVALMCLDHSLRTLAAFVLPVLVASVLALSLRRAVGPRTKP